MSFIRLFPVLVALLLVQASQAQNIEWIAPSDVADGTPELTVASYTAYDEPVTSTIDALEDVGPYTGSIRSDIYVYWVLTPKQQQNTWFYAYVRWDNTSTQSGGPYDTYNNQFNMTYTGPGTLEMQTSELPYNGSCSARPKNDGLTCEMASFPANTTADYAFQFRSADAGSYNLQLNAKHDSYDPVQSNNSQSLTLTVNAVDGSITGYKWEDLNGDEVWDSGESGVNNWSFYYDANRNLTWESNETRVYTNSSGFYELTGVPAGERRIVEYFPENSTWAPSGPYYYDVTVAAGQATENINFANYQYSTYSGFAYYDCDNSGTYEVSSCDYGLDNYYIIITPPTGDPVQVATDSDGNWSYDRFIPGEYQVSLDLSSSICSETTEPPTFHYGPVITSGSTGSIGNLGCRLPFSISGTAFNDYDGDTTRDAGENGISGATIFVDDVEVGTTDSDGSFQVLEPATGDRTVRIEFPAPTLPMPGTSTTTVTVTPGETPSPIEFPGYTPGEITGLKWQDSDEDGSQGGSEVGLAGWTFVAQGPTNTTTTSQAGGGFTFSSLVPGTYTITENTQSGWTISHPSSGQYEVFVGSGETVEDLIFGNVPPSDGEIHGFKYLDLDEDGEKDDDEPGLNGVTINLLNAEGQVLMTQKTHAMDVNEDGYVDPFTEWGWFWFEGLSGGVVIVEEVAVEGLTATSPASGRYSFTLTTSQVINGLPFGNKPDQPMDWGDLPDPRADLTNPCPSGAPWNQCYSTLRANRGPSHVIIPQPFVLGEIIDGETDGQPSPIAVGDDDNDTLPRVDYRTPPLPPFADDEEGLISVSVQSDGSLQFEVLVTDPVGSRNMFLDVWVDLNNDGYLADSRDNSGLTPEDVLLGQPVVSGLNTLNTGVLTPPLQPDERLGFIRMRLSSVGELTPYGPWLDGEVEDHMDMALDFGDAPANEDPNHPGIPWGYPTTLAQNGARHVATPAIRLGQYLDSEGDGQSSIFGDGDDNQSTPDDEDGVFFDDGFTELFMALQGDPNDLTYVPGMVPGQVSDVIVHPSVIGDIDAWFDWNRDGDWDDDGEWVLQGVDVHPEADTLQITIPANASAGFTFSRFRFTANGTNGPGDVAIHGEVEDYLMFTMTPAPVGSDGDTGDANPGDGVCDDGSGQCTLRAAIEEANATGNPTVIDFTALGKRAVVVAPSSPLPAFTAPIVVLGAGELVIDGANAGADAHGLRIQSDASSVLATEIRNFSGDGIRIEGNANIVQGGILTDNGGTGVRIVSGHSNRIIGGSFSGNGALGIDLGDDGVTANDAGDGDSGPNNLQNFPVLTLVTGENARVEGTLDAAANGTYVIQLYRSDVCDASGNGQGAEWLAMLDATTDATGMASFTADLPGEIALGSFITATATSPGGDTSEFSSCFTAVTTSIERQDSEVLPAGYVLGQNYPNPFNPSTTISFSVPVAEFVSIGVFDLLGKQVAVLVNDRMEPGDYEVTFDASALPSGTYIYQMHAGPYRMTRQLTLLK